MQAELFRAYILAACIFWPAHTEPVDTYKLLVIDVKTKNVSYGYFTTNNFINLHELLWLQKPAEYDLQVSPVVNGVAVSTNYYPLTRKPETPKALTHDGK